MNSYRHALRLRVHKRRTWHFEKNSTIKSSVKLPNYRARLNSSVTRAIPSKQVKIGSGMLQSPLLIKISSSKFTYLTFEEIGILLPHLLLWFPSSFFYLVTPPQNLTRGKDLLLTSCSLWSKNWTGSSSKVKSFYKIIGCSCNPWEESAINLRSMDTWNTLCILDNSGGKTNWNAREPTWSKNP